MIRIILLSASGVMLGWFMVTAFMGIVNAGNIFGISICAAAFLCLLFSGQFKNALAQLFSNTAGKVVIIAAAVLIAAGIIWSVILSVMMISSAVRTCEKSDAVIVLGCKVNKFGPSRMLRRRLDAAYDYLSENPEVLCVVSGGQGKDEPAAEADVMKEYLIKRGISESRIITESRSENTYENIKFSFEILEEMGLSDKNISVVTDAFHQCRASLIAKRQGRRVFAVSASTELAFLPTYWVREWLGLTKEIFFGYK